MTRLLNEFLANPCDLTLSGKNYAEKTRDFNYFLAGIVSLITFFVYLPSLQNEFVRWDDSMYVFENSNITSFNMQLFKWAFFHFYAANWHPLTWISHALDYAVWGLNPMGHHLTNNILHALNTFIVVVLVTRLVKVCREKEIKNGSIIFPDVREAFIIAGVTGLLFGLHPAHVESVAWVAERKDLLCALFFLLSILMYAKYVSFVYKETLQEQAKSRFLNKHYLFSLCFFALALLSKPMAVSLPVVLMILDWYPFKRIHSAKKFWSIFTEKIPFLSLSLISSILTILAQKSVGAISSLVFIPLSTRILIASKALVNYLWNFIFPWNLNPFYPYALNPSLLSLEYLFPIVLIIGFTVFVIINAKKQRLWLSVWLYYIITLLPVIGIVQVGMQAMADRYTYLPSLGPFLVVGVALAWVARKMYPMKKGDMSRKLSVIIPAILLLGTLTFLTVKQIAIWKNDFMLWNYIIEKAPERVYFAYFNRGDAYYRMGQLDKAIDDYSEAIALKQNDFQRFVDRRILYRELDQVYARRGDAYCRMGQLDKAIDDYNKAIGLNQNDSQRFVDRGLVYLKLGQVQLSIADFNRACEMGDSFGCNAPQYLK
jgi:protein O-mannosyl-transferase